jgi:hypothetical protein
MAMVQVEIPPMNSASTDTCELAQRLSLTFAVYTLGQLGRILEESFQYL